MKLAINYETTYLTVKLSRDITLTIRDGEIPTITVKQKERDLFPGLPHTRENENVPRYDQGGEYVIELPDVTVIAELCDERNDDPASEDFPREGHATIPVTHLH